MNIIIATGIFPPDIGGPATYAKLIAEEFSARGHVVTVVTYGSEKNNLSTHDYQVRVASRFLPKGLRHLLYFWQVLMSSRRADVIYVQDPVSAGVPACMVAMLLGKKMVLKVVGDYAWEQSVQRFGVTELLDDFLLRTYGFRIRMIKRLQTYVASRATYVIVPSKYLASIVCAWGVRQEIVRVIYNVIESPEITDTKEEVRRKLGITGTVLFSAARLVPWKGFSMLIEILPNLVKKRSDIMLIIAGSGPDQHRLETEAETEHMKDHIQFLGAISRKKLFCYLRAADIFVLNTGYEGFSHQLLEVLEMPTPIITTDAGGNKEIVRDEENVLLAGYNDKDMWEKQIMRLLNDSGLRERLTRNKHDITETQNKKNMIEETLKVLL
jgi:glycosyltransferase involved in cell wall biosynthesis